MRAVIDTNVLLSGLLWRGAPHELLECVRDGSLSMVSSRTLLIELADVLGRVKFDSILLRTKSSRSRLLAELRDFAELIEPTPLARPVCRDPDDDHVLALAVAAKVDWIVSGDNDLLSLGDYEGLPILAPVAALERIRGMTPAD